MIKKKFKITDMHCSSCALTIDMDLEDLEGIKKSQTSYARSECEIEFDVDKLKIDMVVETIKKSGFTAIPQD